MSLVEGVPETSRRGGEVVVIQILRAVAASLIVILHAQSEIGEIVKGGAPLYAPVYLPIGVDIFFVISGIIMSLTTANIAHGAIPAARFMFRRITRIFPLYWIFTALMLAAMLIAPKAFSRASVDPRHVIESFLLIPHIHPAALNYEPVLRVGWTLIYELFFYTLFAGSLLLSSRWGRYVMWAVLVAMCGYGMVFRPSGLGELYTSTLLLEFLYGMMLAETFKAPPKVRLGLAWALTLAAVVVVVVHLRQPMPYMFRGIYVGLPAGAIVAWALLIPARFFDNLPGSIVARLGDGSFVLYLSHFFTIGAVKVVAGRLLDPSPLAGVGLTILTLVFAVVVAQVIHYKVEAPINRLAKTLDKAIFNRSAPSGVRASAESPA